MRCPVCQAAELSVFFESRQVPVLCNVLWADREQALTAPRGDIRLGYCGECGMIANVEFDESAIVYDPSYENSLHFSARFQQYAEKLARTLTERHELAGKQVAEIGCGKGDFLRMLCRAGGCQGIGFDTSYEGPTQVAGDPVRFVRDFYSEAYADLCADLSRRQSDGCELRKAIAQREQHRPGNARFGLAQLFGADRKLEDPVLRRHTLRIEPVEHPATSFAGNRRRRGGAGHCLGARLGTGLG